MKRVYFLRPVGQLGPIKIGCSKMPDMRLDTFAIWSPVRLELIVSVPGDHAAERTLHAMFRDHHLHSEWFGASKELLALIDYALAHGELPELPKVLPFKRLTWQVGRKTRERRRAELSDSERALADTLRQRYAAGVPLLTLCDEHDRSYPYVRRLIVAAGGQIKGRGRTQAPKGVLDVSRAEAMRVRYEAGETLQQIADDYGITRERVRQVLRKTGVPTLGHRPDHFRKPHDLTEAEVKAARLYEAGTPPGKVIEQCGLTLPQLYAAMKRLGIPVKGVAEWATRPDDAELTATIAKLYTGGAKAPEIAKQVGLRFPETVYRYLRKAGVKPRQQHVRRAKVSTSEQVAA